MSALLRPAAQGDVPHPPRPADARRGASLLPVVQVMIFGYAIRTDVNARPPRDRRPAPDPATLALRAALRRRRRLPRRRRRARARRPRAALPARRRAGRRSSSSPASPTSSARGLPARLLLITDATEPNTGSAIQGYALAVIERYERDLQTSRRRPGRRDPHRRRRSACASTRRARARTCSCRG